MSREEPEWFYIFSVKKRPGGSVIESFREGFTTHGEFRKPRFATWNFLGNKTGTYYPVANQAQGLATSSKNCLLGLALGVLYYLLGSHQQQE